MTKDEVKQKLTDIQKQAMFNLFWYSIWEEVLRSTLADTKGEVLMFSTPKGYNHWYDLWRSGQVGSEDHLPHLLLI